MLKQIFKYGILFLALTTILILSLPAIHHLLNQKDLQEHIRYFESIEHPKETSMIYRKYYFGNSSGTSNHCEHVLVQIRKYNPSFKKEIENYYLENHDGINIDFVNKIEDCDGDEEFGYLSYRAGVAFQDQPRITRRNSKTILPVYIITYETDGNNTLDWECN